MNWKEEITKMTEYIRCIKCKTVLEESESKNYYYCKSCYDNNNDRRKLVNWETWFSWELFRLQYSTPWGKFYPSIPVAKEDLYRTGKEKLDDSIKNLESLRKTLEDDGKNITDRCYVETLDSIKHCHDQLARILYYKPNN